MFVISVLLFIISLLAIFRAPSLLTWKLSIGVTEFPWVFILLTLFAIGLNVWNLHGYLNLTTVILIISLVVFTIPIIYAKIKSRQVLRDLNNSTLNDISLKDPLKTPFSILKMFEKKEASVDFKTMVYKDTGSSKLSLDFYPSRSSSISPCIIVIHGGSWARGDSRQLPDLNSYLSKREYHVAAINYRFAPAYKCPAPLEDLKDAIDFLNDHSNELMIDMNNLVLLGRSAGGQIALLAAYTFKDPRIKGVVSFYAPADMVWGAQHKASKWVLDTEQILIDYVGGRYDDAADKYRSSSPLEFVDRSSPPTLLIHCKNDPMVSFLHSIHLKKKLEEHNVKNYFLDLKIGSHGCDFNFHGPNGQLSTFVVERFLKEIL